MVRVVLHEPKIPGNTGNAIRLSAVTGCELHLVEPLGFGFEDAQLRRAGLDYHDLASVTVHPDLDSCWAALRPDRVWAFSARATRPYTDVAYGPDDVLLFGTEPTGLPPEVLGSDVVTDALQVPMLAGRRSLNLSNVAAIAVYEAWRQQGFSDQRAPTR